MQFEARSEKRIAVLSNTIPRNRSLQHTTCDLYRESGIHEDWRGIVLQGISIPRLPRVVPTPNSQHGRQDPLNPDARKFTDRQSEQRLYRETCRSLLKDTRREHPGENQRCLCRETCRSNVDHRIPGIPHSTVQKVDTNRKETVKRLILEPGLVATRLQQN